MVQAMGVTRNADGVTAASAAATYPWAMIISAAAVRAAGTAELKKATRMAVSVLATHTSRVSMNALTCYR